MLNNKLGSITGALVTRHSRDMSSEVSTALIGEPFNAVDRDTATLPAVIVLLPPLAATLRDRKRIVSL